jgi:soluble lytic murein transglycosylase-like protein
MRSVVRVVFASAFFLATAGAISSPALAGNPSAYAALIATHAAANGLSVELASAVVRHESNFNPNVTGRAGEIGLMQIKLSTARAMGYGGTRRGLYDPATNIKWGMIYLGQAQQMAGGSECGTLSRYNAGLYTRHLVRSYCRQVVMAKASVGSGYRRPRVELASDVVITGSSRHHKTKRVQMASISDKQEDGASGNFLKALFMTNE